MTSNCCTIKIAQVKPVIKVIKKEAHIKLLNPILINSSTTIPVENETAVTFSYGDAPRIIKNVVSGSSLLTVEFIIQQAFNVASTIQIKDDSNNIIIELTEAMLVSTFEFDVGIKFTSNTGLHLFINAGAGTNVGSGIVFLTIV